MQTAICIWYDKDGDNNDNDDGDDADDDDDDDTAVGWVQHCMRVNPYYILYIPAPCRKHVFI